MSSPEIVPVPFMKLDRSFQTPPGSRLATFEEVQCNLDTIKELLHGRETARLLDGWISGPCHNFQMGDNFRGCMGYMLVIQIHCTSDLYANVSLTQKGKEVALLLCCEDWNLEVAQWLLNSWENINTMEPPVVRDGSMPFSNATTFLHMIGDLARKLGDEGHISEEVAKTNVTPHLVLNRLISKGESCWNKLNEEHKKLLGQSLKKKTVRCAKYISRECLKLHWLPDFASQTDVADAVWNFLWADFSSMIVAEYAHLSLRMLISDSNVYTCILYYLSLCQLRRIIKGDVSWILNNAFNEAGGHTQHFKEILQNGVHKCCKESGSYDVLSKILILAAREGDTVVVKKALNCGALPLATLSSEEKQTALHWAIMLDDDDKRKEIAINLFKCNAKANMVIAEDNNGQVPLHYAVKHGSDKAIELLIDRDMYSQDGPYINQTRAQMADWKDKNGQSPLDLATGQKNMKLVAKLLGISEMHPRVYFDRVNVGKLLCQFAVEGNTRIVSEILESGANPMDADEDGKTAFHHAAMCEDEYQAMDMVQLFVNKTEENQKLKMVLKRDRQGRTVLHEAAAKQNEDLCQNLLSINPGLIDVGDVDGRNAVYDAVNGKDDNAHIIIKLSCWMKGMALDALTDRKGVTLLHLAASRGKIYVVDALLSCSQHPKKYVKRPDYLGQTAIHKAAKGGHLKTLQILFHWGAHPFYERDRDGRTALHYAVQAPENGESIIQIILNTCNSKEHKFLLLWASPAGLGTAEENASDPLLRKVILQQKREIEKETEQGIDSLLKAAACVGNIELATELVTKGANLEDIGYGEWYYSLPDRVRNNVDKVHYALLVKGIDNSSLRNVSRDGERNDQPTAVDYLGREDLARGLAGLFLSPNSNPPIVVGISGSWGMGKSSLMLQTRNILLRTAAQLTLLPSSIWLTSKFPGVQTLELSKAGEKKCKQIQRWIAFEKNKSEYGGNFFAIMMDIFNILRMAFRNFFEIMMDIFNILRMAFRMCFRLAFRMCFRMCFGMCFGKDKVNYGFLTDFLSDYDVKRGQHIFKLVASMDRSEMFVTRDGLYNSSMFGKVPAILTVTYNAWKYKNDSEALAGMAVEITQELEGLMTDAQWLSTCWRNTWKKEKKNIWIKLIFPCLLAVFLAGSFTWIVWVLLNSYKVKESEKLKWGSVPATIAIIVWNSVKSGMSFVNPVSAELLNYIKFPDHKENLGYQDRVISDINFLKEEIGRKPFWICAAATFMWHVFTGRWIKSLLWPGSVIPKAVRPSNANDDFRIILFVDDLDRCEESVILQVLSAINLVLAECKINVILGMDKAMIERAIQKRHGDDCGKSSEHVADMYLQKIVQLPIDLPEPSQEQSERFLKGQLNLFNQPLEEEDAEAQKNTDDPDYDALFSVFDREISKPDGSHSKKEACAEIRPVEHNDIEREEDALNGEHVAMDVPPENESSPESRREFWSWRRELRRYLKPELDSIMQMALMVFVEYSEGELQVIVDFQKLATGTRKFPREWKRLLNYLRVVRNVLFITNATKDVDGWQLQLISWTFLCWECEENMNIIIQNWNKIKDPKVLRSKPGGPSLLEIVECCMENYERWMEENKETTQKLPEDIKKKGVYLEDLESSDRETVKLKEIGVRKTMSDVGSYISKTGHDFESNNSATTEKFGEFVKEVNNSISRELDMLKKEIKDLKEQVGSLMNQQASKTEYTVEDKIKIGNNWVKMKSVLENYDVTMAGIQAFQRFRFFCMAGDLPWKLPKQQEKQL